MTQNPSESSRPPLPHAALGARIKARREELGLTQAEVGKRVGRLTRNAVSMWEAGANSPSATHLMRLAKILEVPLSRLLSGEEAALPSRAESGFGPPVPDGVVGEVRRADVELPPANTMPRDVPVYGRAAGSIVGAFQFDGIVDYVRRPPGFTGAPLYALYIVGQSMAPEHKPGDLRFVHPGRPPRPDDTVIVQTRAHEGEGVASYIKTLVRMNDDKVVLKQLNPEATITLDRRIVVAVHRVLTLNELFGV